MLGELVNGRNGSVAALKDDISSTAAIGREAVICCRIFGIQNLNVCFHQKR